MNFNERIQTLLNQIELTVFHEHFTKGQERIDICLIDYLQSARDLSQIDRSKSYLNILLEYSWEKLNTGIWQNVKDVYRYLYAYACYIDVLIDCRMLEKSGNYQVIVSVRKIRFYYGKFLFSRIL
jgi:hypothetical protein